MVNSYEGAWSAAWPTDGMVWCRLRDVPGVTVTYGVVRPERFDANGIRMLQAQDFAAGRILDNAPMMIRPDVHQQHPRTCLKSGDLVLVLVGRVGDAAVITERQQGWNAARSVGVVRCEPSPQSEGFIDWLRYWFMSSRVRQWFAGEASGFAQPTLSVSSLANLHVPLPPIDPRRRYLDTLSLAEQKADASMEVARAAIRLADANFDRWRAFAGSRTIRLGDVCQAKAGGGRPSGIEDESIRQGGVRVATADVLNAEFPHWRRQEREPRGAAAATLGQLLIATRKGTASVVLDMRGDARTERGTLAVRARDTEDQWWLLHEIRTRSAGLAAAAQGEHSRELSARAFGNLLVPWPEAVVRAKFAETAQVLHERALLALDDHDDMRSLLGRLIESVVQR